MSIITIRDLAGVNIALTKINQDAYTGEYFKRVLNTEYRVKVRHTNEKVSAGVQPMARHNVDVTVTTFSANPTLTPPLVYQAYFVFRNPLAADNVGVTNLTKNLALFLTDLNIGTLVGWDTDVVGVV